MLFLVIALGRKTLNKKAVEIGAHKQKSALFSAMLQGFYVRFSKD